MDSMREFFFLFFDEHLIPKMGLVLLNLWFSE